MKNLMKKSAGLFFCGALLLISACSNLASSADRLTSERGKYNISGKVSFDSDNSSPLSARTATSSLSETDGLTYEVSAIYSATLDDESSRITGKFNASDMTYFISLPENGLWQITIKAKKEESILFSGLIELDIGNITDMQTSSIVLYPNLSGEGKGAIKLNITSQTSKVVKLSYSSSAMRDDDSRESPNIYGSASFAGGKAVISEADVSNGSYMLYLSFEDEDGNCLYSCYEMVNVFAGFTTDSWYGSGACIKKDSDGSFSFVLTDELIEGYGTETEKATKYALYKEVAGTGEGESLYRYYLTQSLDMEITDATDVTAQTESGYDPSNAFCLDGEGNFYAITKNYESAICITSNKDGFGSLTAASYNGAMYLYGDLGSLIAADRKTNTVYTLAPSNKEVYKITGASYDESMTAYNPAARYQFGDDSNSNVINFADAFAVNNNIAYFVRYEYDDGAKIEVVIADLSAADPGDSEGYYSVSGSELHTVSLSGLNFWDGPEITDILYQDGAVYILFREQKMSNDEGRIISRGGLLRYDLLFGSTKVIGWTESTSTKNFTTGVRISSGVVYESYTNENELSTGVPLLMDYSTGGGRDFDFYAPYGTLNSAFAGPQKFIAVKPKKLVISDSGTAFFTDDEGILKYKDVNRVVEVDLEELAITASTDIATEFATSYPVPGSTNFFGQSQDLSSYWTWSEASNSFVNVSGTETPYGSFIKED